MKPFAAALKSSSPSTMKPHPIISLDLETGGLYAGLHPIVSVSVVTSFTSECLTFYVDLSRREQLSITPEAREKNGYDYDLWLSRGALPLPMILERLVKVINDLMQVEPTALLLAHNAGFDRSFLDYAFEACGLDPLPRYQWRCSQQLLAQCMDTGLIAAGSLSLTHLGELSGFWHPSTRPMIHEALEDAEAALHGYHWLLSIQARPMDLLWRYWNLSSVGGGRTADWLQINGEAEALLSPLPHPNPPVL